MTTKRSDSKSNRPTYNKFDVRVNPRPGRHEQQQADAASALFRAYYDQKRTAGISPQAAYETWLETPGGRVTSLTDRAEVERIVAKLMLAWQMSHTGE